MRRLPAAIAVLALCAVAGCRSEPETVLESDLPQVPGMAPRDTTGLRQEGGRVIGGQFAFKGPVPSLKDRVSETMARFEGTGWTLSSQTITAATALLVYRKDTRTVRVEIIRNGVQPLMSTAVLTVGSSAPASAPQAPAVPPAPPAPVSG